MRIADRIHEIACKIAPDYPGIGDAEQWEQLYAIEAAHEGALRANADLHKLVSELAFRLELTPDEVIAIATEATP